MEKILRIGVFGTWRGNAYLKILNEMPDVKITAICDKRPEMIEQALPNCPADVKTFAAFDSFIDSGLFDAVLLANYFNEHTPFAVKAMKRGIHVLSETTAAVTPAQCVELVRTVEETGCKYMLAENYPFMCACQELKRVYEGGTLGKVLFAEGEYVHPMSAQEATYYAPEKYQWRRWIPCTFYLTHALSPLMHMTGAMPKKVNARAAFDPGYGMERKRYVGDRAGIILCEMDNDAIFRVGGSCNFGPHGNWYRLACDKGGVETVRGNQADVWLAYNAWQKPEGAETSRTYTAQWQEQGELASKAGHGGGDFWVCWHFVRYILDDVKPYFDVYQAVSMAAVGIYAWRSILADGATFTIPDFRSEAARKVIENDTLNPIPDINGNGQTLACSSRSFPCNYED